MDVNLFINHVWTFSALASEEIFMINDGRFSRVGRLTERNSSTYATR